PRPHLHRRPQRLPPGRPGTDALPAPRVPPGERALKPTFRRERRPGACGRTCPSLGRSIKHPGPSAAAPGVLPMSAERWIADRMCHIEVSGVRKVFDLARSLKDPINLSIGQPEFDVPAPIKAAAHVAIDQGRNGYTPTQGIAELRDKIRADVRRRYPHADRE